MRNKLLLTTAFVMIGSSAQALTLDFTPYISAKVAFARMRNKQDDKGLIKYRINDDNLSSKRLNDNVFGLRLAGGVSTPVPHGHFRTELELSGYDKAVDKNTYKLHDKYPNQTHKVETSVYSAMLNFYYDIDTSTALTPYVEVGFGGAYVSTKVENKGTKNGNTPYKFKTSSHNNNFAWNIGVGTACALNDKISLDLGYRYTNYGSVKGYSKSMFDRENTYIDRGKSKIDSHEVNFGVRYMF